MGYFAPMSISRRSLSRILTAAASVAAFAAVAPAAHAQGADEWLPDCSATRKTLCVVATELNETKTTALKALVQVQKAPTTTGRSYQVYFTQPQPFGGGGGGPGLGLDDLFCNDGSHPTLAPGASIPTCVDGSTPQPGPGYTPPGGGGGAPGACPFVFGPVTGLYCGDLTGIANVDQRVGVTINVGNDDPKAVVIRGGELGNLDAPNRTWTATKTREGNVVEIQTLIQESSVIGGDGCNLNPLRGPTNCGGETSSATWTGTWATISVLNLDGTLVKDYAAIAKGTTMATNAEANGPPLFDKEARTLSVQTGGPHFKADGTTLNQGFIYAFLPDSLLQAGPGFGLPPDLTPEETLALLGVDKVTAGSAAEQLEPDVDYVEGGVIYAVPQFGFSSPKFQYKRRQASGAFTSKATATRKKVGVTLTVSGQSKVSIAGKFGKKAICAGSKSGSGNLAVSCKLSSAGKKLLGKAKKGARVNVKVTVKGARTETRSTYALVG